MCLENEFRKAMVNIYHESVKIGYRPTYFLNMLANNSSAVGVAEQLILAKNPAEGFTTLWELKALKLTVEALVYEGKKWHTLFEPEVIEKAHQRLIEYGFYN